ncbi:WD40 domain-containing protein [Ordospora colligata]|nr:WD40 domain-containing protein [Ordospora colligata]TBU19648.1 WD40 domain-containing protein [Ordospora colligata]
MMEKEIKKIMEQETARVKSLSFHPSKPVLVSGHHSGSLKAWDYQMNVCIHEFLDHDGSVRAVQFHPHGDLFVSGGDDKVIRIWNYTERRVTNRLYGHDDFVRSLDFHPTKPWILSASDDQTIMVWNMMTGKLLATARGHSHYVMCAKFLGEDMIVSGSLDQSIRIWDCKGLKEGGNKKSTLLPDIVVKQIVDGHERGVNAIAIGERMFVSGGDDRDIKCWEWTETSVWEKETMCFHQGPVTGLLCCGSGVLSTGEDGLFSIFDVERRKSTEYRVDGRYWCAASKGNVYAAGHDSGLEVYMCVEPKIVCKVEAGVYYVKEWNVYLNDFKTEKVIYKPKKKVESIYVSGEYLLVRYADGFEVVKDGELILSELGEAVFVEPESDCDCAILVVKNTDGIYEMKVEGGEKKKIPATEGKLFRGSSGRFFVVNEKNVGMYTTSGVVKSIGVPFRPVNVVCLKGRVALIGTNDVHVCEESLDTVNAVSEMATIQGGFFHGDVFVYSTLRHLKYVFEDKGVLKSVEKCILPFSLEEGNMVYFVTDGGIECMEVDLTEIEFKNAVQHGGDVIGMIEGGMLPGMAPLSYLVRQKKGAVALPYIKDGRQRFELCLSDGILDECLSYCMESGDMSVYRRLAEVAVRECRVDIAEKCYENLNEWNMLFMLYVCSKEVEKIRKLAEKADESTRAMARMYLEDLEYFVEAGVIGKQRSDRCSRERFVGMKGDGFSEERSMNLKDEVKNEFLESDEQTLKYEVEETREEAIKEDGLKAEVISEGTDEFEDENEIMSEQNDICAGLEKLEVNSQVFDESALGTHGMNEDEKNIDEMMESGLALTTAGKFSKAIEEFRLCIARIASEMKRNENKDVYCSERRLAGAYISGLIVEKARRKMEDPLESIVMAVYVASLPLKKEHHSLAKSTAIAVLRKYGNFGQAKEIAKLLGEEGEGSKIVKKAIEDENMSNEYEIPEGTFCHDVLGMRKSSKQCKMCFIDSAEEGVCRSCEIGVVE